ncbi:MAG TPA: prepilin-type N-terminal cleavage/methylation domain-containing protein [Gemmatimonadales bacterium]|nr:prepilin-type N-terminal cleavage/methylation domain-containing protein [Gemmatimonadales bacterium]
MSPLRAVLRDQRGFTLTELLVVATVLGMILAGVVLIQMQGQQAYLFGSHRVEVQQNNRAALELMVRDLRSAESVTTLGSPTDLTFVTCQDPYPTSAPTTPCLPADVVTVRYQVVGTTLNRTVGGTTTPLIGGVQTLTMAYYSAWNGATNTGTTTTTPASVKLVRLQLVTGTEDYAGAGSPANQYATMESLVRLRNMP